MVGEEEIVPGAEKLHLSHISGDGKTWVVRSSLPQLWNPDRAQAPATPPSLVALLKPGCLISPQLNHVIPGRGT